MAKKPVVKVPAKKAAKAPSKAPAGKASKAPSSKADGANGLAALLDDTPSIPQVFIGIYKGVQRKSCIVYKRDDHHVWTVMLSENGGQRVLHKWGADTFVANMRPAPVPEGCKSRVYPLKRAIDVYLKHGAVYEDAAYRVLLRMSRGQDPTQEDTLDEILDVTPSFAPRPMRGTRTAAQKADRRAKRKAKMEGMTPAQQKAWRDKRNEYRRLRRLNKAKARRNK